MPAALVDGNFYVIKDQRFRVRGGSYARLALWKGHGPLSCFTDAPNEIRARYTLAAQVPSPEGLYACYEGRDPLEHAARQKMIALSSKAEISKGAPQSCSVVSPAAVDLTTLLGRSKRLEKIFEDDDDDDWGAEEEEELDGEFWVAFDDAGGDVGGGGQCMSECNLALGTALRFCALAPDPIRELCILGAGALYVACIAGC